MGRCIWNGTDFWGTLTEIGPLFSIVIAEAIGHRTIGAIDHTSAAGVFNSRDRFLILFD